MRVVLWLLAVAVGLTVAAAMGVRLAPSDPGRWHVDPATAPAPSTPNAFRAGPGDGDQPVDAVTPVYDLDAADLAARLDAHALAQPRTSILSRSDDGLWTTYLVRSRIMGFPDYVSVRARPEAGGGATLAIFSRSRFGQSDLGVNRARVESWLAALAPFARNPQPAPDPA